MRGRLGQNVGVPSPTGPELAAIAAFESLRAGRDDARVRVAALRCVLALAFASLAEARGLAELGLADLCARPSHARLRDCFADAHASLGGETFDETRLDALGELDTTALDRALEQLMPTFADADVEALGHAYEVLRSSGERRRTGSHYTPRALAETIVARTLEPLHDEPRPRVCDPAMGAGVFLLAACRSLGARLGREDGPLRVALTDLLGVDRDPIAVELARLSLWLETRARALPLSCFDHALRCGDALLGLDVAALARGHWDAARGQLDENIIATLAAAERAWLHDDDPSPAAALRRAARHAEIERMLAPLRERGDRVLAAFLSSTKSREREAALADPPPLSRAALHWRLAFPQLGPRGVDAVVGNPPFAGKNSLLAAHGRPYLDWLKRRHPGSHGNADYAAHFLRLADTLIGERGTIGLLTTNTISQGDTRTTGLAWLLRHGLEIYDAVEHLEWPGVANVTVSRVCLRKGEELAATARRLGVREVVSIDSRLRAGVERPDPQRLVQSQRAFIGTYVLGRGFVLTPAEREQLLAADPRNVARIRPYLGGEQLNGSPTQTFDRYAIDFGDLTLARAEAWPDLLARVREQVKPQRERLADNPDGRRRKANWWQHGRITPALEAALAPLSRCVVTSLVNKHLCFAFAPARWLFSHKLCVVAVDSYAALAVLQSRVHGVWARLHSSTMRNAGINYAPSDCFETFPWPAISAELEQVGERFDRARAAYMRVGDVGLTKTYNALTDAAERGPEIGTLRELHVELDRAVLAAYGWGDLAVPGYHERDEAFERAVVDRLYGLNGDRIDHESSAAAS